MSARVLLIGLDGATFDLIDPWVASGDLPNLGRLMRRGARAPLRSTLPAMTFPAWSSMMTGVNPGKHGIFDFTRRVPGRYAVEFVNATHRRAPTVWRLLSDAGLRVGVAGLPATYPPEPVNGFTIAGFDAPVAVGIDRSFAHPPELLDEIRREVADYPLTDFQELNIGADWHAEALQKLHASVRTRTAIAEHLLSSGRWDVFMLLFGESDTVGHHFWRYHDPHSPRHDPAGAGRYGDAILSVYRLLDEAVGKLTGLAPEATVIVLSDHGFGGTGERILYLNRWLAENGFLRFATRSRLSAQVGRLAKRVGLQVLPGGIQEQVFRRLDGRLANRLESSVRFGGIDWPRTAAYSEETNTCPSIWINLQGREPGGTVRAEDYESLREEIISALGRWRNPDTGRRIVARAWRREEIYSGPHTDAAPDILLELALDGGYAYTCLSSQGRPGPSIRSLEPREHMGAKGRSMNGSHRPEGVFIMSGTGVEAGAGLDGADLTDIAPTVLSLLDQSVPAYMDGRSLAGGGAETDPDAGALEDSYFASAAAAARPYAPAEAQTVAGRLRRMGYLE